MSRFTDVLKTRNTDPEYLAGYEDAIQRERLIKMLVQMREDAGIRQEDVAQAMGVGQSTVSQFENATDPRLSTVQRYARAVNAQVHLVAATRSPRPKEWPAPEMIQRPRTHAWSGFSETVVHASQKPSKFAKAA